MPVVVVANPKGGVGKSTLSTQVAGFFAMRGHAVMLGDTDRQQSSRLWLGLRPASARPIRAWELDEQRIAKPPKGTSHVVLDTPAGLHGKSLGNILKKADKVLVPLQPSVFDIFATRAFLDEMAELARSDKLQVGLVGMRLDARTLAAEQLETFVQRSGLPMVGYLRDTQNFVHLAAHGLTLFDVARSRVERDLELWQPIGDWLEQA